MPTFNFSATPVLRVAVNAWIADPVAAEAEYGHISGWDTSAIDNMSGLFQDKETFNDDISQWDTSNVTSMADMFNGAEAFNQDITGWNTSKVTNMGWMFKNASVFDQDIRKWDVSNVHTFTNMFAGDVAFQDTYGVPDTPVAIFFSQFDSDGLKAAVAEHFQDAAAAEAKYGKLTKYDTSLVTDMSMLFRDRATFNLDISGWNTSNVEQFESMFNGAEAFNQDIGGWDVSKARHMEYMFKNAKTFNANIGVWNMSSVTTINNMFDGAIAFNQPIGLWNVSNVKVMNNILDGAIAFNQEIRSWTLNDDANVDGGCYDEMFWGATAFHTAFGTNDTTSRDFFTQTKAELKAATLEFNQMESGETGYDAAREDAAEAKYGFFSNLYVKDSDMSGLFAENATFNRSITTWNKLDQVTTIEGLFENAVLYNKAIPVKIPASDDAFKLKVPQSYLDAFDGNGPIYGAYLSIDREWNNNNIGLVAEADATEFVQVQSSSRSDGAYVIKAQNAEKYLRAFGDWIQVTDDAGSDGSGDWALTQLLCYTADDINTLITLADGITLPYDLGAGVDNVTVEQSSVFTIERKTMPLVTNITKAFKGAAAFNQPVDLDNFDAITDLTSVFEGATSFDQDISGWNTSSVTIMNSLLKDTSYNKDISVWSVSNVTDFSQMFMNNTAFYYDIRGFDVSSTANLTDMFNGATLFKAEFGLPATVDTPDYRFFTLFTGTMSSQFTSPLQQRMGEYDADVEGTKAIYGDINHWNTDGITQFAYLTYNRNWNHDISEWKMSGLRSYFMFYNNTTFNQNISTKVVTRPSGRQYIAWDMSSVESAQYICYFATNFNNGDTPASELYEVRGGNNPINWNTSSMQYCYNTFNRCIEFNQCINSELVTLVVNGVTTEYISNDFTIDRYGGHRYRGMNRCPYFNNGDIAKGSSKPIQIRQSTNRGNYGSLGYEMISIENMQIDIAKNQQIALGRTFTGSFNQPWEHNDVSFTFSDGTVVTYNPLRTNRNSYMTAGCFRNQLAFNQPVTNKMLGTDDDGTVSTRSNYVFRSNMFENCESFNSDLGDKLFEDLYSLSTYYFYMSYDYRYYYGLEGVFNNCKVLNKPIPLISYNRHTAQRSSGGFWYKSLRNMFRNCESLNQDMSAFMQSFADVANAHTTTYSTGQPVLMNSMFENSGITKAEITSNMNVASMNNAFNGCTELTGDLSNYTLLQENGNSYLETPSQSYYSIYQTLHMQPLLNVCKNCSKLDFGPTMSVIKSAIKDSIDDLLLTDAFLNCNKMTFKNPVDLQISSRQNYNTGQGGPVYENMVEWGSFDNITFYTSDITDYPLANGTALTGGGSALVSTNQGVQNTVSRLSLYAKTDGTLSFNHQVSSEDGWDQLVIQVSPNVKPQQFTATRTSGGGNALYYYRNAGEQQSASAITLNLVDYSQYDSVRVDLCYFKDASVDKYNDTAYFSDFVLTATETLPEQDGGDQTVGNKINLTNMFNGCAMLDKTIKITPIEVTAKIHGIYDLTDTFTGVTQLPSVELSQLNITSLNSQFKDKSALTSALLSQNTVRTPEECQLTDIESVFEGCSLLTDFSLPALNNVTTAKNAFKNCIALNKAIDLSSSELVTAESALEGCTNFNNSLTIDGPKVTDLTNILKGATSMSGNITATLPVIQSIGDLFQSCKSVYNGKLTLNAATLPSVEGLCMELTALNTEPSLTLPVATNAKDLFKGCTALNTEITLNLPEVTTYESALEGCTAFNNSLTIDGPKVTDLTNILKGATSMSGNITATLPVIQSIGDLFQSCKSVYNGKLTLNAATLPSVEGLFMDCTALNTAPELTLPVATSAKDLFKGCTSLNQELLINLPKVQTFESALEGCTAFNSNITIDGPELTNVTNTLKGATSMSGNITATLPVIQSIGDLFQSCKSVYNGKLTLNAATLPSVEGLFMDCTALNTAPELTLPVATSAKDLFKGCTALNTEITLNLPEVTTLESAFERCTAYNKELRINAAKLINASKLLKDATSFNQDITDDLLNTPLLENLESAFEGCTAYNKDVDMENNTKNVTNMKAMFKNCTSLDEKIDMDSSKVTTLESFLEGCIVYDSSIRRVDTTHNVVSMKNMFKGCVEFNQNIESLETTNLETMEGMLEGCIKYDQNFEDLLAAGNKVTNMKNLLKGCVAYNQCIEDLQTENVETMESMLEGCVEFNQCLCDLKTSKVTNFKNFLKGCIKFDQCLNTFDTSVATNLSGFLEGATSFNRHIVFDTSNVTDMSRMLAGATSFNLPFNKDIEGDDGLFTTANVTTMESFLEGATSFNEALPDLVGTTTESPLVIVNTSDFLNGYSTVNKLHIGYLDARFYYFGYWPSNGNYYNPGRQYVSFTGSYNDALDYVNNETPVTTDGYFVLGLFFTGSAALEANNVKKQIMKLMDENTALSVFIPDFNTSETINNDSITETIENNIQNETDEMVKQVKKTYLSLMNQYEHFMEQSKTERTYDMNFDPIEYAEVVELNDTLPITPYISSAPETSNPMRPTFCSNDTYGNTSYYGSLGYPFWSADTFIFPTSDKFDRLIESTKATQLAHYANGHTWLNWNNQYGDIENIATTIKTSNATTYSMENMKSLLKNATSYSGNIGNINPIAARDLESVFEGTNVTDIPFTYMDDENYSIASLKNTFKSASSFNGDIRTIPVTSSVDLTDTITGTAIQNTLGVPLENFNEEDYIPGFLNNVTITDGDGSGFTSIVPSTENGWTRETSYGFSANRTINLGTKKLRIGSEESSLLYWGGGRLKFTSNTDYTETLSDFYLQEHQICWCWDDTSVNTVSASPDAGAWYKITDDQLLLWVDARSYGSADDDSKQCYIEINLTNHSDPTGVKFVYGDTNSGTQTTNTTYWNPRDGVIGINYADEDIVVTTSNTIDFTQNGTTVVTGKNCFVQKFQESYTVGDGMDKMTNKIVTFTRTPTTPLPFPTGNYFDLTARYFVLNKSELSKQLLRIDQSEGLHDYIYGPFDQIYTTKITDMSELFKDNTTFNRDISHLDVSNVTNMSDMFFGAAAFNQDIGGWDVSQVTNMHSMFENAAAFNQDIGQWNVSQVTNMDYMFRGAAAFNQDINTKEVALENSPIALLAYTAWDVSNVTNTSYMFFGATAFNQDIGQWDVSKVTNMSGMFWNADAFNQDIGGWDVSNVTNMYAMFYNADAFNQDIGGWDVSNVTNMNFMFFQAAAFNQAIGDWNVSNVTNMYNMFAGATFFNQNICNWDVSNVTDMRYMFNNAPSFDGRYAAEPGKSGRINTWNVQSSTNVLNMFNQSNIFSFPFENYNGVYKAEWFSDTNGTPIIASFFNSDIPCFGEQTVIFAKKDGEDEGSYHPIIGLEKGDLVKTLNNGYLPISFIGSEEKIFNRENDEIKDRLYTMESPEGLHPLTLTGRHAILVDDWSSHYASGRRAELSSTQVEGKYVLGAGYSTLFTKEEEPRCERVYHFALDGPENRYGVLANGILCETLDKNSVGKLHTLVPDHEIIQSMDLMVPDLTSHEPEPEV